MFNGINMRQHYIWFIDTKCIKYGQEGNTFRIEIPSGGGGADECYLGRVPRATTKSVMFRFLKVGWEAHGYTSYYFLYFSCLNTSRKKGWG
jgi:hypothetical protein